MRVVHKRHYCDYLRDEVQLSFSEEDGTFVSCEDHHRCQLKKFGEMVGAIPLECPLPYDHYNLLLRR